jgi:hypothetical protein
MMIGTDPLPPPPCPLGCGCGYGSPHPSPLGCGWAGMCSVCVCVAVAMVMAQPPHSTMPHPTPTPMRHAPMSGSLQNKTPGKAVRVMIINKFLCHKICKLSEDLPADDRKGILRGTMAWAYISYHKVLDESEGLFLTDDEVGRFTSAASTFLKCLQELMQIERRWVWRSRPKHHQLEHIMIDMVRVTKLNPKKICCLLEEDFLGKLKKIASPCRGLSPLSMSGRLLDRYMVSLALRWKKKRALQVIHQQ